VTTVLTGVIVLPLGEIVPTSSGLGTAKRWAVRSALAVRLVGRLRWPAIVGFDSLPRRVVVHLGAEPGIERPALD
jgi:CBS domain containing-hemolysin-like protein